MPVRVVHHSSVVRRAAATVHRMRAALRSSPPPRRLPIPLLLPCELLLLLAEQLPPEAVVRLVCCCAAMRTLYARDGATHSDALWAALLQRTFPVRLTGAPGPNAPPRLKGTARLHLCTYSREWTAYCASLKMAPKVTGVQIAKFVRWAAAAHSWYKHLPLQEAALFSFVLDLTVGMRRTADGFVEQRDGDARTHYSWLPTHAYRDAFGLLTYRDALPAFVPHTDGPRSVGVMSAAAARAWVPAHLVALGSCKLSAACHSRAETYRIYHHAYDAYAQAVADGSWHAAAPPHHAAAHHSYSYLGKDAQKAHFRSLPAAVLADFAALRAFKAGDSHGAEARAALIEALFPRLSAKHVAKLQWGFPWDPAGYGADVLGTPNICVTAQKAREWQRMFDAAAAFCEAIYGEPVCLDGVHPHTMTCLALAESLPLPMYDLME
ncbi:hypothetical protein AB1Y20_001846 [Prymnesium parvum]|uniref:F-box domain-containing protein n=1 Tax=Prymnesium parvum TaxID=97485 RepID=A0AB34K9B7_PRYPA